MTRFPFNYLIMITGKGSTSLLYVDIDEALEAFESWELFENETMSLFEGQYARNWEAQVLSEGPDCLLDSRNGKAETETFGLDFDEVSSPYM